MVLGFDLYLLLLISSLIMTFRWVVDGATEAKDHDVRGTIDKTVVFEF